MTILKQAVGAVLNRADHYKEAENYYEGVVGETFATSKLRQALRASGHTGQHNYCRVVVDSVLNRLEIANVVASTDKAQAVINKVWKDNELGLEANGLHQKALEFGDTYALVWPDAEGNVLVSYQTPLTTAIVYDPENPRKKLYAVRMWKADDNLTRLNIYYPDHIAKYSVNGESITEGTNWTHIGTEENPFGEIPVFHFRTHRPFGLPEHFNGYGCQNDINKLLATHFFSIDYQGAPQRYALAHIGDADGIDFEDDESERENVGTLKNEPGNLWMMRGIDKVGEFKPADPDVYWKPIGSLKESLAALTDTPFHFLERDKEALAGEARRVAEAPHAKKVRDRQASFAVSWSELFRFVLKIEGMKAEIKIEWADLSSLDTLDEWTVQLKKQNAGLSQAQGLRERGYSEEEIVRIQAERLKELEAETQVYQRKQAVRVSTEDNEALRVNEGATAA